MMNEYPDQHWYPQRAIDAWLLGCSVIPLREGRIGDPTGWKVPDGPWKPFQKARCTKAEAEAIGRTYAIVTGGRSGVVGLDIDGKKAFQWWKDYLPESPMRTRTGKPDGLHVYYRHPGIEVRNGAKLKGLPLDVRGDGGYLVGPGSLHWTGRPYEAEGDWSSIENLPVFDPSWIAEERKYQPSQIDTQCDRATLIRRAMSYLDRLEPAVSGNNGHSKMLYAATCLVGKFKLGYAESLAILLMYNRRAEPPFDDRSVERKLSEAIKHLGS